MNHINDIVFEVYKSVLNMDYNKNQRRNFLGLIKKLFRYIISGYIFQVRKNKKTMVKLNEFKETLSKFDDVSFVIYTVSIGKYDFIQNPIFVDDRIKYYVFTDQDINSDSIWEKKEIPTSIKKLTSLEQARYIKTHPHEFFPEYDYSMFIDGNVRITCDVFPLLYTLIDENKNIAIHRHQSRNCIYDEATAIYAIGKGKYFEILNQVKYYKKRGFPKNFGLFETNIVIRRHNDPSCVKIMNDWWNEMFRWTKRDQLSFTYVLWKNNLSSTDVLSLGNNSRRNPYFIVDSHK